jgi:hypothetical protein
MSERLDPLTCRCLEAITFFLSTCHPWHSIQAEWYFKRFLSTRFTGSLHAPLRRDSTTTLTLFTAFWSVLDRPTCESQANILWKLLRLASSVVLLWKRAHYFWSGFKTFTDFSDVPISYASTVRNKRFYVTPQWGETEKEILTSFSWCFWN